ncbi:MAG TPA: VWA domain-containing protein [Pyrinomonadaceae bacterium]|nr:VWA domain-containing protein [Pyrinomonadaceae bacterium]
MQFSRLTVALLLTALIGTIDAAFAQDDVVRINTELVQTTITVVDKKGKFVEGLNRGDFELLIDGKPRQIDFLERVSAGSAREAQLAQLSTPKPPAASPTVRGRTIIFYIDDLHLSFSSLNRTRQMIAHFLDSEINGKDLVAIVSARGQIGFLQQFTNNKQVLEAALARINAQPSEERTQGMGNTPMSEFTAFMIDGKSNSRQNSVMTVYIEECLKQTGAPRADRRSTDVLRLSCENLVKSNARAILTQTGHATERMYESLESLMRSSVRLPGRKIVFFISDSFLSLGGPLGDSLSNKLKQVTDAAQRANAVVYSIDARGLVSGSLDATNNLVPDANGRMATLATTEILATQDALNALAEDTGGRALRNQNYFERWVEKVLDETSNYYVIAWRPTTEEEKESKFRNLKIRITSQPDLTVRAPRGYIHGPQTPETIAVSSAKKSKANELHDALADNYASGSLETMLSLTHLNSPANGPLLTSSFQIAGSSLDYGNDGKQSATVKLAGVILNDKGKVGASFQKQLDVKPINTANGDSSGVIYSHREPLAPGIYQVRVAARDERSGRVGSAMQWVVIPDLSKRQLTLSSLLIGGQVLDNSKSAQVQLSVDHHFSRSDHLGYWIFVYNAKRDATGATNLVAETEVLREGKVVLTNSRKLSNDSPDPERIPYGADLTLKSLAPGTYDLRVKIIDAIAGTSASQTTAFIVQ